MVTKDVVKGHDAGDIEQEPRFKIVDSDSFVRHDFDVLLACVTCKEGEQNVDEETHINESENGDPCYSLCFSEC